MIRAVRSDYVIAHAAFEHVRQPLLTRSPEYLDRPVGLWVAPEDRGLPMVFMQRSVRALLATPFDDLYCTPGVGHKKIMRLVGLLQRAALVSPDDVLRRTLESVQLANPVAAAEAELPSLVAGDHQIADEVWNQWRSVVAEFALGSEAIGRYVRSLRDVSRPVWHTPLGFYSALSLSAIRETPAHGQKRLNAVLEVFDDLHAALAADATTAGEPAADRAASALPHNVRSVERWLAAIVERADFPSAAEIDSCLVAPLLAQIRIDADPLLASWAESQLPDDSEPLEDHGHAAGGPSLFQIKKLADMLQVRWPHAASQLTALQLRAPLTADPRACKLLNVATRLISMPSEASLTFAA
jgi:hypothetical protein